MDYSRFMNILNGRFENLPKESSKIVRIFLSSTFTDTHEERDYLIQHIYPRLRNYCKLQYGLDFQILDMRWGISDEVTNTHMATTICLNEVRTSQKLSVGPNFIAFLSHRYGARCLPTRIIAKEFEIMKEEMKNHPEIDFRFTSSCEDDAIKMENVIEDCYILDKNETPARYRLKYISAIIPTYSSDNKQSKSIWDQIEKLLGNLIRKMADICFEKKLFTKTQHERYFVSVTEKEIFNGIINAKNVSNNVLLFIREIEDVKEYKDVDKSIAWRYIDVDDNNEIEESAQSLLNDLKNSKLSKKVPEANTFRFRVKWARGMGVTAESHPEYMKEFGETFYQQVKKLIDKNQSQASFYDNLEASDAALLQEVLEHAYFCNETVEKFHGRNDLLNQLKQYLFNKVYGPLVIHGPSGCGKTAILAKLTSEILKSVPDPANYSIILRFLGTTPATSTIAGTMNSVFHQIARILKTKPPHKHFTEAFQLREFFSEQLAMFKMLHPNKKLVLVFDSLDQLSPMDYNLLWLYEDLPENVKVIYSTLPDHGFIVEKFRSLLNYADANFLKITELDQSTAKEIIVDWLAKVNRSLSSAQWKFLDSLFAKTKIYPLYIKLLFDIVCKWQSYYDPESDADFHKCIDIDSSIEYLFKLLEKDHGKLLFSRTIIYMIAFQSGISEGELEDILSLDDDVLYDVFKFHAPPVRRLPVALWSRIKYDLDEYLVEKEVDDSKVLTWYHRRFFEVSKLVYVSKITPEDKLVIYSNVVDFFNETWKHKPKPYRYNDYLTKKKKLASNKAEAVRDTTMQPTAYIDSNGKYRINKRKIRELPVFVPRLEKNASCLLACEHMIFSYDFMYGMLKYRSTFEIFTFLANYAENKAHALSARALNASESIKTFLFVIFQTVTLMKDFPESLSAIILSRILYYNNHLSFFTKFIAESDKTSFMHCALTVPYQFMPLISSSYILSLEKHSKPIEAASYSQFPGKYFFTLSDRVSMMRIERMVQMGDIKLEPSGSEPYTHMIVHTLQAFDQSKSSLKELNGNLIVMSPRKLASYSFDSLIRFSKTFDASERLAGLHMVTPNHVIVRFVDRDYCEVYNVFNGELVLRREFNAKIKLIATNIDQNMIVLERELWTAGFIYIAVSLEHGSTQIFKSNFSSMVDQKDNSLKIEFYREVPQAGYECIDLKFLSKTHNVCFYDPKALLLIYEQASFGIFDLKAAEKKHNFTFHQLDDESMRKSNFKLKLTDHTESSLLMIGSDGSLFLFEMAKHEIFQVKGRFDRGLFVRHGLLAGISNSSYSYYVFGYKDNVFSLVELHKNDPHFGRVTYAKHIDDFILSTSADGSIKVLTTHNLHDKEIQIEFDKAASDIVGLVEIDNSHVASISSDSNEVNVWNLSNGKISTRIRQPGESDKAFQMLYLGSNILVVAFEKTGEIGRQFVIRGFKLNSAKYKQDFSLKIESAASIKLFKEPQIEDKTSRFIILSNNDSETELYFEWLSYEKLAQFKSSTIDLKKSKNMLKLAEYAINNLASLQGMQDESLLANVCLLGNSLIAIFFNHELTVFDPISSTVLIKKSLLAEDQSVDYFLSPTNIQANKLTRMSCFASTSTIVCINNIHELVVVDYDAAKNKLIVITSTNMKHNSEFLEINSFGEDATIDKLLLAHDSANNQIVLYDVDVVLRSGSFKRAVKAKTGLNDAELNFLGFSSDSNYAFSIENSRVLKFFSLRSSNMKPIAQVPLYSIPTSCLCTSEFMSLSMQDKRVISFLITDPDVPGSVEKIAKLESRTACQKEKDAGIVKSVKKIIHKFDSMGDKTTERKIFEMNTFTQEELENAQREYDALINASSGNPDDDDHEYKCEMKAENIEMIKRVQHLRTMIQTVPSFAVFSRSNFLSNLGRNWMLELLFKSELISKDHYDGKKSQLDCKPVKPETDLDSTNQDEQNDPAKSAEFAQKLTETLAARTRVKSGLLTRNSGRNIPSANSYSTACSIQ